ncbi:collagen-like protein [Paenibacillus sp. OSY-SE]|uniref:collagen-like protein n=1 Tax=Paenibacillus sp. OSY-SE TaxID=1196323 RepID=UPI0002E9FEE7|nr:collagen-like protein [Paenibacillus sp. OSY-SE]
MANIIQIQLLDEKTGQVLETVVPETEARAVLMQSGQNLQAYLENLVLQQGPKGDTGPQGAAGPKGDKGDKGDTGLQGAVGPKGDKGAAGAAGPKGDTGAAGAQGPKGNDGSKMHNVAAVPAASLGAVGDWALNTANGDVYEKTAATTWTKRGNLKGATGAQGLQGAQGLKGDKGATGAQGPKGDKGEPGAQGPKGDTKRSSRSKRRCWYERR